MALAAGPHQRCHLVPQQCPVVHDVPVQHDEQEQQAQHDVAQVAEDVVEGTVLESGCVSN